MERLTRLMIRYRWAVVAVWLVVLLGGGYASTKLSGLLANTFTVPGTDSERVRTVLSRDFGDRSDGSFTVVFQLQAGLQATRGWGRPYRRGSTAPRTSSRRGTPPSFASAVRISSTGT